MRALKVIVGLLIAAGLIVVGFGLVLPKEYRVERSIEIDAAPEVVFDHVNTLKSWDAWSPWMAKDPSIENSYSGPEAGVGSKVTWTSENSGNGSQTITFSKRPKRIEMHLDFGDMGRPRADWTFEPSVEGVRVTWGLSGTASGVLGGYFAKMMDDWVGPDYEDGLARLKKVVEEAPPAEDPP